MKYGHAGGLCNFDAFFRRHSLTNPALQQLAIIVRGGDNARFDPAPQCAGRLAQSLGLSAMFPDDHVMLQHGLLMYDVYCARIKQALVRPMTGNRQQPEFPWIHSEWLTNLLGYSIVRHCKFY